MYKWSWCGRVDCPVSVVHELSTLTCILSPFTVADSLYFESMHIITEDWPMTENEKMFKVGECLLEVSTEC